MNLDPSTQTIDSSKLQEFQDCPRKFMFRHVFGWQAENSNHNLIFGTCLHSAMDALYSNGFNETSLELAKAVFLDEYREYFDESVDEVHFPKSPAMVYELLDFYYKWNLPSIDRYECLYTEIAGSVPILNGHRLHFRIDNLSKDLQTNQYFIREYKSTSRNDRQWRDQWLVKVSNCVILSMKPV